MQDSAFGSGRPSPRTGLLGAWLCLCAFAIWASEVTAEPPVDTHAAELQKSLQQLSNQIGQLRQTTTQTGQLQLGQGETIKHQIGGIERQQSLLDKQLRTLDRQSLQQIEGLQSANHKLVIALWSLMGCVLLLLSLLILLWRTGRSRPSRLPACPAATPSPQPSTSWQAPATPAPIRESEETAKARLNAGLADAPTDTLPDNPAPIQQPPAAEPEPAAHAVSEADSPAPPAAPAPAPWASLVAADLHSTEQAIAQARASFMQPARIDS